MSQVSDPTWVVALIGAVGLVLAAAIPAYFHARGVAKNVGKTNGHGTLAKMTEDILLKVGAIEDRQGRVIGEIAEVTAWRQELERYLHEFKHRTVNDLAGISLKLDVHIAEDHANRGGVGETPSNQE